MRELHEIPERRRIAIVGSRDYPDLPSVRAFVRSLPDNAVIVSGGARGVDQEAERAAKARGLRTMIFPADWRTYGRRAGYVRNEQIVDNADEIVAFWNSKSPGTADTIRKAQAAGKPARIFRAGGCVPSSARERRLGPLMSANVVHCKAELYDVYIGRQRSGMHFGNPFGIAGIPSGLVSRTFGSRAEAIAAYREWLTGVNYAEVEPERRRWILQQLPRLRGKTLGCFCRPAACHGDVLVELLERLP